jgi:hypothetical protein
MIPFKKYYNYVLQEAKEGDRVGIQHLYSYNKPELYSMGFENFKKLVEYLEQNGNKIDPSNSSVSEKIDGMALKVGNDENGKFFVQSSYSGKVYNPQDFAQAIKYPPAQQAFMSSFDRLKEMINSIIGDAPCVIQLEWLYSPNATKLKERPGMVSFVTSGYKESNLGSWSTFVVLKVDCEKLDPNEVKSKLLKLSTKEAKFMLPDVEAFTPIDLGAEVKKAKGIIEQIESKQIVQQIAQLKGDRKREAIQKRKSLEQALSSMLLPIQKEMYEKIVSNLTKTEGILGDIEGYVVKAGDLMFKANNPEFMKTKFDL